MKRAILITFLLYSYPLFAAEPPPPQATTEVLELRKALFEERIQNLANAIQAINQELEKRKAEKAPSPPPTKQPEKK
jgi:hypothetical protein